nr:hypothetical protein [Bacteroidota bacterium]
MFYNFNFDTINNGNNLFGVGFYNQIVIVPSPKIDSQYYLLYSGTITPKGFYYAIIDMAQNKG